MYYYDCWNEEEQAVQHYRRHDVRVLRIEMIVMLIGDWW